MPPSSASMFLLMLCLLAYVATAIVATRNKKYGYIMVAFCIYHIAFLLLPALFHTAKNVFPFYATSYGEEIQVKTAIICLSFTIFFLAGFFFTRPFSKSRFPNHKLNASGQNLKIAILIIIIALVGVVASYGIPSFMSSRREFSNANFGGDATTGVVIITASRAASFLALLFMLEFKKSLSSTVFYAYISALGILFVIVNFPPSLSRYLFFSYILAVLYIYTSPTTKNKIFLFLAFLVGTITIFPFFNFISRGASDSFELDMISYYTTSGDFDGYQSIINVVQFTEDRFFTYGGQIIGALLIFVPRSIWPEKPFATGQIAAENMAYQFTNISSPLIAEMYIDFGYFGITALAYLIGMAVRKIDSYSVISKRFGNRAGIILCAIFFSFSLIILRGALIGVASTVALELFLAYILAKFIIIPSKKRSYIKRNLRLATKDIGPR